MCLFFADKCDCPPPNVTLLALPKSVKTAKKVYRNNAKPFVYVKSEFFGICNTKIKLVTWELTYISKSITKFYPIVRTQKVTVTNSSVHRIVVILLQEADLVYIRCRVKMIHSQGAIGYDYGFLRIIVPEIVANISGKTRVSKNEEIVLDASRSYDPVMKRFKYRYLRFKWTCKQIEQGNAVLNSKRTFSDCNRLIPVDRRHRMRTLKIKANQLDAGDYIFSLTASKRNRRKTVKFKVTVVPPTIFKLR